MVYEPDFRRGYVWIVKICSSWKSKVMPVRKEVVWSNLVNFWASRVSTVGNEEELINMLRKLNDKKNPS